MEELLNFILAEMQKIEIPYEFQRWTAPVTYPYFVGEYGSTEPMEESGLEEKTFLITGFSREGMEGLIKADEAIRSEFPPVGGKTAILGNGSGVAVFYAGSMPVDTGEADLKRLQISLTIKFWRVN